MRSLLLGIAAACGAGAPLVALAPEVVADHGGNANDHFVDAIDVGTAQFNFLLGTNVGATADPGEPAHAGNPGGASVWYRWTAAADGTAHFDLLASSFDTLLAVYTGASVDALTEVAASDDAEQRDVLGTGVEVVEQSVVDFVVTAGTTYWIAVDGRNAATGDTFLTFLTPAPDSDLDGHDDAVDNCVFVPNPSQGDEDADGDGNACEADFVDSDGDDVEDDVDNCVGFAHPNQNDSDADGRGDPCDPRGADGAVIGVEECRTVLPANDDASTPAVPLGFGVSFFGVDYDHVFVNNNGNVTFDEALETYTPFDLSTNERAIIAPFLADVDTSAPWPDRSGLVTYSFGATTYGGRPAFCAEWLQVGYFAEHSDKLNTFQLLLVDRSDVRAGDFDIIFNYDQIQWESGDASNGVEGLGGESARAGYSNGIDKFFELPGAGVAGALLDSNPDTGLIHNSVDSLQPGRYIFEVRNGDVPIGGRIHGDVVEPDGDALAGAPVQVCAVGGNCHFTVTNSVGSWSVSPLPADDYQITAFAPAASSLRSAAEGPIVLAAGEEREIDLVLAAPDAPPTGTSIDDDTAPGAVPVVRVGQPLELRTTPQPACVGASAEYEVTGLDGGSVDGTLTEGPAGTYTADLVLPFPGPATVVITFDACAAIAFDIDVLPAGVVRSVAAEGGTPIADATVTLSRSDTSVGPFEVVPDGSAIMAASNRTNPDTTDAAGAFGWNTIAGHYVVRAAKAGCTAPDGVTPFVETAVLTVPPAIAAIDLRLSCGAPTDTDGDGTPDATDLDDDGDGVSDLDELAAGSDPLDDESTPEVCDGVDNDGNQGTDEGFPDTDNDGERDCVDPDDDGDGFSDVEEVAAGSDPLDDTSTPEVCDGVDNDGNQGSDEFFADFDGDGVADCVDPDDDDDGLDDVDDTHPFDPDRDADGALDGADNCVSVANRDQSDIDRDDIGDRCDATYLKGQFTGDAKYMPATGGEIKANFNLRCDPAAMQSQKIDVKWGANVFKAPGFTFVFCGNDPLATGKAGFDAVAGFATGTLNGAPATVEFHFVDGGSGPVRDTMRVVVRNASGAVVLEVAAGLTGGGVNAHAS